MSKSVIGVLKFNHVGVSILNHLGVSKLNHVGVLKLNHLGVSRFTLANSIMGKMGCNENKSLYHNKSNDCLMENNLILIGI